MIKTVVWDWNGTLLDDVGVCITTINTLLNRHGYAKLSGIDEYREKFCFPIVQYYRNVGIDFDRTPFDEMAAEFMEIYHPLSAHCKLQPDSICTLQTLKQVGKHQVLLSASMRQHLVLQTARYPLVPYFDHLLGIEDIYAQSKLALAQKFVAASNDDPAEILFIGDSVHDAEVASGCGCSCVLFSGGHQSRRKLEATGCTVIDHLPDLCAYLRHDGTQ